MFPTRILLATDGSNEAVLAEDAAVEISGSTGSELHVVHVVLIVFDLPYPRGSLRERNEAVLDRRKIRGLRLLEERVRRIEDLGGAVAASHYREGNPKKEVLRLASELDAGLIITGARGARGSSEYSGTVSPSTCSSGRTVRSSWSATGNVKAPRCRGSRLLQEMARSIAFTFGSRPVQSFCASTPW